MTAILVLYEDSRGAKGEFRPHDFFVGCVADSTNGDQHDLKRRARAYPVKGVGKLLSHLRDLDDLDHLAPGGAPILAVLDNDHVREHFPPAAGLPASQAAAAIRSSSSHPERLTVVLLEHNMESVVEAMRTCGEKATELIAGALRKGLNERDQLFGKVAHDPARKPIRDCVREKMQSAEQIVQAIRAAVA